MLKRTALLLLIGLGAGFMVSLWLAPTATTWGSSVMRGQICTPQIVAATRAMVHWEIGSGVGGALLFAIFGNVLVERRRRKSSAAATTVQPAGGAAPKS